MRNLFSCCTLLFVVAVSSAMSGRSFCIEPQAASGTPATSGASSESVLLLKNGGVLNGRVSQDGTHYVIAGARSTFDVPATQVAMVCQSLDEAYDKQRQQLEPHDAEGHLRLAEWCLRNDMLLQTAQQLTEAEKIDPHAPMSAVLKRRLDVAMKPKSVPPLTSAAALREPAKLPEGFAGLEIKAAELPAGSVEKFTRKIQPLLVNNCTTSGCHQPSSAQSFQLDRAVLHGMSNRRTTLANLTAALALINQKDPQSSPLLTIPRDVHAGMKQPIFGTRQKELDRQLSEWVALVTNSEPASDQTTDETRATVTNASASEPKQGTEPGAKHHDSLATNSCTPVKTARTERKPNRFDGFLAAKSEQEALGKASNGSEVQQASYEAEDQPLMPPQPLRTGGQLQTWQPKDAFDAEIFNRQTQRSASDTPVAPAR